MSTPTSPGWYPDPEDADQLRYFDGIVWSAHTTPLRPPTPSPAANPPGPSAPPGPSTPSAPSAGPYPGPADASAAPGYGPGQAPPPAWSTPPARLPAPGSTLPDGAVLAEWWRRLLARAIDWFVTSLVSALLSLPFISPLLGALETYFADAVAGRTPDQAALQSAIAEVVLPVTLVGLVVGLVYEVGFLVWKAATPGKMVLGTLVRPADAPGAVTPAVALRRQVIAVVTAVLGLSSALSLAGTLLSVLDPAWLLWDRRRQTLHDKVADTVVVLKRT